ncbi:hypothetical protein GCM10010052_42150 [Paenarthrobacter histidinolovorans]|nr:hypothetical protein GCM10010052_42150 [Paenarthrobacter histidinolovorans]
MVSGILTAPQKRAAAVRVKSGAPAEGFHGLLLGGAFRGILQERQRFGAAPASECPARTCGPYVPKSTVMGGLLIMSGVCDTLEAWKLFTIREAMSSVGLKIQWSGICMGPWSPGTRTEPYSIFMDMRGLSSLMGIFD